jgi:hypothetical protein
MHLRYPLLLRRCAAHLRNRVAAGSRRQRLARLAALLVVPMLGIWTLIPSSSKAPTAIASVEPQDQVAELRKAEIPAELIRFALNALLVPLLDDAVPPHWTGTVLEHTCGPGTRVLIDGKPLQPHSPMPARSFSVHWTMDRCLPFGFDSVELSGSVELLVFHEDGGLSAVVMPHRLQIHNGKGGNWFLERPFSAAMSLAPAPAGGA